MSYIPTALRHLVTERANHCCEYCQLPDNVGFYPHELDPIVAQKHGGLCTADNLVLACWRCNRHKRTDLGSFVIAGGGAILGAGTGYCIDGQ